MAIAPSLLHRPGASGAEWWDRTWSSLEARVVRRRHLRTVLPMAWLPVVTGLGVAAPVALVLHGNGRSAVLGALAVAVAWAQLVALVAWRGTRDLVLRRPVASSTGEVLRSRRRQGWRALDDVRLPGGRAIDHVVAGPSGLVVVETKRRRDLTAADLAWAADQVRRNVARVASAVGAADGLAQIRPLIVVWDAFEASALPEIVDDVAVVRGPDLAAWLDAEPRAKDLDADLAAAWRELRRQAAA